MATAIGDLVAKLRLDTGPFGRSAKGSIGTMGKIKGAASSLGGALGSLGGRFAALVGIGGLGFMIKQQFDAIDSTAKLARQVNITVDELMGLRLAAEQTGAGAGSLDAGLGTLSKRLGEAARGGGAASAALKELGLDATDLAAMNTGEAFFEIAGAMSTVEGTAKRNAIAANLFSKANMKLLLTLDAGVDGLQAYQDESLRVNGSLNGMTGGIEAANDAMDKMKKAGVAVFASLAIALAPFAESLANELTDGFVSAREAAAGVGEEMSAWGAFLEQPLSALDALSEAFIEQQILITKAQLANTGADVAGLPEDRPAEGLRGNIRRGLDKFDRIIGGTILAFFTGKKDEGALRTQLAVQEEQLRLTRGQAVERFEGPMADDLARAPKPEPEPDAVSGFGGFTPLVGFDPREGVGFGGTAAEEARAIRRGEGVVEEDAEEDMGPSGGGPRFAGAMERGSASAFTTIVNAGKQGQQVAKQQLAVNRLQLSTLKDIARKTDAQTVSIPQS